MNPFDEYTQTLKSAHMEEEFFKFQTAFNAYKRIIVLGNGGSSSVASHISQDYMKSCGKKVSILSDPSMITMLTNDFGYKFAYQKFLDYSHNVNKHIYGHIHMAVLHVVVQICSRKYYHILVYNNNLFPNL